MSMLTILFGLLAIFGVTAVALISISKDDDTTNEFAVNHIEGYDVQSVRYVRDAQGNWTTVSVEYKRR